jgi:RNA polymerase primary sigma factor
MNKWTVDYVKKIQQLAYETDIVSLNSTIKTEDHDDCELGDFVIDKRNFFEELDDTFNRESILSLIHQLNDPRMERILILRYGLDGSDMYRTLDEIGEMYGVTRERIRQIEDKALLRLRRLIQNKQLNYDDFIGG